MSVLADTGDVYAQNTFTHAVRWLGTLPGAGQAPTPQTHREAETCFAGWTAGNAPGCPLFWFEAHLLSHAEGGHWRVAAPTESTA